ncbi:MAG: 4-hydroxy-tetrahydrodipicolinate synthase [Elusimicrobia bacterium RIFOXYA12_FULL_51_18]|nr:MAG: 4-hydroxy-tetrahydrodipicolinate synthase [Elusimicrobia bacterium RIFOXYA12_FULL_51_18]OGS31537.1 MAG: 4-hydroxy-tetrahydrodipicolinate synthase [Elusimicrobia bacterium RIFOXYA2_FULL_53_38]
MQLKGCFTAVITPFKDGKPDLDAFRKLVRAQIKAGVSGLVPCGSTGEAATLTPEEYGDVIKTAVEEANGKVPVMPGVGTNSTAKSAEMLKKVEKLGVDGALVIVPYYNKPTQDGMIAHFSELAKAAPLPLTLYNIPGRTGVNMLPATVLALRKKFGNIVGIKEASGSLDQVSEIVNGADKDFAVMCGDDSLTLPMMSVGARGVISVVSNVAPKEMVRMCELFVKGGIGDAKKLHHRLFCLIKALFVETNPIPVKYAMHLLGYCAPDMRLPLTPLSEKHRDPLKKALINAGIKL